MNIPLSPCVPENLVSRDGFSRPVPRQPAHLHTHAESGAYLRDSSRVPRRRSFMKPPYAIGSVPSLSGHAIAYRWRSLPRVFACHFQKASLGGITRVEGPLLLEDGVLVTQATIDRFCGNMMRSIPRRMRRWCGLHLDPTWQLGRWRESE